MKQPPRPKQEIYARELPVSGLVVTISSQDALGWALRNLPMYGSWSVLPTIGGSGFVFHVNDNYDKKVIADYINSYNED